MLATEGFKEIQYNEFQPGLSDAQHVVRGYADMAIAFAPDVVREIDAGTPIVALAGLHVGCQELFANDPVYSISDLKGRKVLVSQLNWGTHLVLSVALKAVGIDPIRDIEWVDASALTRGQPVRLHLFESGQVDAYFALPPHAQELRRRGHGRLILRTSTDLPWSQYFCCMLITRREFADNYPVATKRMLRAILKSTDFCASDPASAADLLGERVPEIEADIARGILDDVVYDVWREYDPADTLRFFALRLNEVDFINSSPSQILSAGTDWRHLDELRREMKG
jgi:NitT/TauT family transport system substrate-binding protein